MSNFDIAIIPVLKHEGGYVDNANDPGGATNYGISLRWLSKQGDLDGDFDGDGDIDVDDIKAMTQEGAIALYHKHYWQPNKYHSIRSQIIANKVFDLTVNMGAKQSHKLLQRALRSSGISVLDDGILGKISFDAIDRIKENELLAAYRSEAAGFYRSLIMRNAALRKKGITAEDFTVFKKGWLNRAYA